jgi:hypothetical protein
MYMFHCHGKYEQGLLFARGGIELERVPCGLFVILALTLKCMQIKLVASMVREKLKIWFGVSFVVCHGRSWCKENVCIQLAW